MQTKGSLKCLPCRGLLLSFYELLKLGVLAKWNIEKALKSRRHILDRDCLKLSLGISFFLSCLMESFFTRFQDLPLLLSKHTHQKAANLTFRLILPVAKVPWWFLGMQYTSLNSIKILIKRFPTNDISLSAIFSIYLNILIC